MSHQRSILAVTVTLLSLASITMRGQNVIGFVYEDRNINALRDSSERGLSGIPVSNGREVVLTSSDGAYNLPMGPSGVVFVIKPKGYRFLADGEGQSKSYYVHSEKGSSKKLKYTGIKPTGPLPRSVDFGLIADPTEENSFSVLLFGDTQVSNEKEVEYLQRSVIDELEGTRSAAFGITLGDLVNNVLDLLPDYKGAIDRIGLPWYHVIGNHDHNQDVADDSLASETFRAVLGPENYAVNYGKVHLLVLDDILFPDPKGESQYWGGYREDQLTFIKNDLKHVPHDRLVIIAQHIPLFNESGDSFNTRDRSQLFELLRPFENVLLLSAHTHYQMHHFFGPEEGWYGVKPLHEYNVGTVCGDWWSGDFHADPKCPDGTMRDGTPRGFAYIDVNGTDYKLRYEVQGADPSMGMRLYNTRVVDADDGRGILTANIFMGRVGDIVEYSIDGGEWRPMTKVLLPDPSYAQMVMEYDEERDTLKDGRRPNNPIICSHIWSAGLPRKTTPGEHIIKVRTIDSYGREYMSETTFRSIKR